MNYNDLRIIVGQIKKTISCQKCKGNYTDEDIVIIGNIGDEQTFFHASCQKCEAESIINVTIEFDSKNQQRKLGTAPRMEHVSTNEVLDMHNFLKNFNGDFITMFKEKPKKSF